MYTVSLQIAVAVKGVVFTCIKQVENERAISFGAEVPVYEDCPNTS